jgi:CHRD domain
VEPELNVDGVWLAQKRQTIFKPSYHDKVHNPPWSKVVSFRGDQNIPRQTLGGQMKQPGILLIFIIFIATVGFVLAQQEQQGGRPLTATLTGGAEVPGPGDADGTGTVKITLNPGQGQVCYELTVANIATATAAHIHSGAVGIAGPVLVTLKAPVDGSASDCAPLDKEKIDNMIKNPQNYYVNVHNADFPKGAIRGQLAK